ncbi:MAG TPA: TonB-dependent receptor [Flavobacteriaceae bacterium]|mgnify:CR=1 FL=1|nr:TonB-dependent receptor [Flavobacteriaceae bacterium]MCB9213403.1 TonB-dependent receptor [Alteromonas sp.]HPF10297.1 TonB-dependent receptor [Flavobacteriaceae bacterium]HQU20743.1 TonB-dependent receptor [Flavobacteriaceae bacterium]HQU64839.1 TonB-dependent receptor [Flavobacteriaceae bacterium]
MRILYLLPLAALCLFNTILSAQNTLSGTITDTMQQPISATIYLPQLEKGTISDFNGNFTLPNIPNGNYTVVVSSLGFETVSQKILFGGNTTIPLNLQLKESVVEMEEVIISTPFHQLQSDNVMKVERVSTADLTKEGAVNLSQGIANIAGVSAITTGTGIGKPVIRGLSANRVLTYAQGVRLENQQFGDEHGLGISGAGIESVEVIKGPASLLYGSDALGGVLYLNPEAFAEADKQEVDFSGGYASNTQGLTGTAAVKGSGTKFKYIFRGSYNTFADYKTGDGTLVTNSRYKESDYKVGLRYQVDRWKSTFRYNFNRNTIGIPEEIGLQNTDREPMLPFQKIDNHILSWENNLYFDRSSLDVKVGFLFNDRNEFEETAELPALQMKLQTFNYDVKYHWPSLGKFETISGVQGMVQENKNYGEELLIPDAQKVDAGVFTTTHLHLNAVDFQGGLRYDFRQLITQVAGSVNESNFIPRIERQFHSFNAALGVKYDWGNHWTARLNLASGFRAPNLAELASNGVHEGTNRYEIGNAQLKNEQNIQTDLALEYRSEHLEMFVNGFYNTVNHYIFIAPTGDFVDGTPVFAYEQFDANLYGGEAGFHWHPHPLDWLHWESSFETVTGELRKGGALPLIPANQWKNTLRFEGKQVGTLQKPFAFVTFKHTFEQNRVSAFETPTEGYSLWSLGVGGLWDLKKIQLGWNVNITNLTNEVYIDHLSRLKTDAIPNAGRSINCNLSVQL